MDRFELVAPYKPTGDQPEAIQGLVNGVNWGLREQTLLGVTGSGKTFTMASVIAKLNRPTLVLAHNKTLAAQLCSEFREFFPDNAVEYFISYYDYYRPEAYMPAPDMMEMEFKAQMGLLREMRAKALEAAEKEKQDNLEKKLAIIEKMKEMAVSPDEADKNYEAFKGLQAEWKEIKNVPAEKVTELWKSYQLYVEQFYDQLRLNHEMRAYDFKKNLEIKTRLCETAEKLAENFVDMLKELK